MFSALLDEVKIIHENQVSRISIVSYNAWPLLTFLQQQLWTLTEPEYNTEHTSEQYSEYSCLLEPRLIKKTFFSPKVLTTGIKDDMDNLPPQMNEIYQSFLLISKGNQ